MEWYNELLMKTILVSTYLGCVSRHMIEGTVASLKCTPLEVRGMWTHVREKSKYLEGWLLPRTWEEAAI
jgi:hypothetical protein